MTCAASALAAVILGAAAVAAAGVSAPAAGASAPSAGPAAPPEILKTLRPGHPRVILTPESIEQLRADVKSDPAMKAQLDKLVARARGMLNQPAVEHKLIGPRLLDQSRRCFDRVSTLALVYLVTGDKACADRAVKELEAAAAFADWNPSHFLDTAEMSCAFGIGYDWLYTYMSADQRATVRRALMEKGIQQGLESYRGTGKYGWWTRAHHNWSQVCNGGLALGALAVADEEPAAAAEIIESGLKAVRAAMANFGPDGSWNEGPGYWGYTMQYTSLYLDTLRTALGTMKDLDRTPGLAETGLFRIASIGPTGRTFNFADAGEGAGFGPAMGWLARTFDCPLYAAEEWKRASAGSPMGLIWQKPDAAARSVAPRSPALADAAARPADQCFRRDEIVFLRSAWNDPRATWVGLKGGDNAANHSHLDLGSFVLEAAGTRWAVDLGSDDYNLPDYFGGKRWTYYRLRTESHNTLLVDGENQPAKATVRVVAFQARSAEAAASAAIAALAGAAGSAAKAGAKNGDGRAIVDLAAAYPMTKSARRGVAMLGGKAVLVQDEVEAAAPVEVLWGMVTRAKVTAGGAEVTLEQGGQRLLGRILAPAGAVFDAVSANPPPPQAQQPDATKLVVRLPEKVTRLRLAVVFRPEEGGAWPDAAAVRPLAEWPGWLRPAPAPAAGG